MQFIGIFYFYLIWFKCCCFPLPNKYIKTKHPWLKFTNFKYSIFVFNAFNYFVNRCKTSFLSKWFGGKDLLSTSFLPPIFIIIAMRNFGHHTTPCVNFWNITKYGSFKCSPNEWWWIVAILTFEITSYYNCLLSKIIIRKLYGKKC